MPVLGFFELLLPLQLGDCGFEFANRFGLGGQLFHLRVEDFDLRLQRRDRNAHTLDQNLSVRRCRFGGRKLKLRQFRIIRFQFQPALFQRSYLLANAAHHRILLGVLGKQPLLLLAKRIEARGDAPVLLYLIEGDLRFRLCGWGFRFLRQQLQMLLIYRLLLRQLSLGVEQLLPDLSERLAV